MCCRGNAAETPPLSLRPSIVSDINASDLFIISKPGCPYCASAHEILADERARLKFSYLSRDFAANGGGTATVDARDIEALSNVLDKQAMTFPVVFLRGQYIGGRDELRDIVKRGDLAVHLKRQHIEFAPLPIGNIRDKRSPLNRFLARSDGGRGNSCMRAFQLKGFANVVRAYAAMQVVAKEAKL